MIRGIHHTSISTRNLDRLLSFYCDLLGLEKVLDEGWEGGNDRMDNIVGLNNSSARAVMLDAGNTYIEMFEYSSPTPAEGDANRRACDPAITHICFDVADAVATYEKLSSAGVFFHSEPQRILHGVRTAYARDPDGNIVEFQEIGNPKHVLIMKDFSAPIFGE